MQWWGISYLLNCSLVTTVLPGNWVLHTSHGVQTHISYLIGECSNWQTIGQSGWKYTPYFLSLFYSQECKTRSQTERERDHEKESLTLLPSEEDTHWRMGALNPYCWGYSCFLIIDSLSNQCINNPHILLPHLLAEYPSHWPKESDSSLLALILVPWLNSWLHNRPASSTGRLQSAHLQIILQLSSKTTLLGGRKYGPESPQAEEVPKSIFPTFLVIAPNIRLLCKR